MKVSKKLFLRKMDENDKLQLKKLIDDTRLSAISNPVKEILFHRGFRTVEAIEKHLYTGLDSLYDTRLMKDAPEAVELIKRGIDKHAHFVVYGDYDSDGCGATATSVLGLRNLGAKVDYFTNNRFVEGYGICPEGLNNLLKIFPTCNFIITVDNGIMGHAGIQKAKDLGITVIVIDHHEQGKILPNADAIVDPKREDCQYPFKGLCGAGLVFKILLLLYWEMDKDLDFVYSLLDIVAVSTVGDLVPLVDENRVIVREGIKRIRHEYRPVFRILREISGITDVDEYTLGFKYAPMINALGRIDGSPENAIVAFTCEDEEQITEAVNKMNNINEYRKVLTAEQEALGIQMVEEKGVKEVIVLYHDTFHEGIVGLVAGRIKELYNRPTIVLAPHHGIWKGSGRSIEGFHIKEVFDEVSTTLLSYGGHAMAGGLSVDDSKLKEFEEAIINVAKSKLTEEDFIKKIYIDSVITPSDCSVLLIEDLDILKPFGQDFENPILALKNFKADKVFFMGKNEKDEKIEKHVKLIGCGINIIWFNYADYYKALGSPDRVKCLGYPSLNVYNNNVTVQFMVKDDNLFKC